MRACCRCWAQRASGCEGGQPGAQCTQHGVHTACPGARTALSSQAALRWRLEQHCGVPLEACRSQAFVGVAAGWLCSRCYLSSSAAALLAIQNLWQHASAAARARASACKHWSLEHLPASTGQDCLGCGNCIYGFVESYITHSSERACIVAHPTVAWSSVLSLQSCQSLPARRVPVETAASKGKAASFELRRVQLWAQM
jgi:hypothetical protein